MPKCPVCKTECGDAAVCPECGFEELNPIFLSKEEGTAWIENVVWPYRERHWKSSSQFNIRHTGLFWELVECNATERSGKIRIPYGIEVIGKRAFRDWKMEPCPGRPIKFPKIVIPSTVSVIEHSAFETHFDVKGFSLNIPNSVVRIGDCAFKGWSFLFGVDIPKSVQYLGESAFCSTYGVFCEAEKAPVGWAYNAFYGNTFAEFARSGVHWGGTWHYDERGEPMPNE